MKEEQKRVDCKTETRVRCYNGMMIKFRLPTEDERVIAENNALAKKAADEDFDLYL